MTMPALLKTLDLAAVLNGIRVIQNMANRTATSWTCSYGSPNAWQPSRRKRG